MTPQRIQRSRAKGWKMPDGAVYVGRPTKWGNPYRPDDVATRSDVVRFYRECLLGRRPTWNDIPPGIFNEMGELRGKDLACWCPLDQPCHADVLLELANKERP